MIQLSGSGDLPQLTILLYLFLFDLSSIFRRFRKICIEKVKCLSGHSTCYKFVKVQELLFCPFQVIDVAVDGRPG